MATLGIDTSGGALAVGLIKGDRSPADLHLSVGRSHSKLLAELVHRVLRWTDHRPEDLRLVAVTAGPGSYTGLRLGAMAAKTFAWWARVPVVGVSSLYVLAARALYEGGGDLLAAPVMQIRRGYFYGQVFTRSGTGELEAGPVRRGDATALGEALAEDAGGRPVVLMGEALDGDAAPFLSFMEPGSRRAPREWDSPRGSWVARLGDELARAGQAVSSLDFVPDYGEEPVARPGVGGRQRAEPN